MRPNPLVNGAYDFATAARLTGLPPSAVRRWFVPAGRRQPLLTPDFPPADGRYAISFLDLLDVFVIGHCGRNGIRSDELAPLLADLRAEIGHKHAIGHERFAAACRVGGDGRLAGIVRSLTRAPGFDARVRPMLRQLDHDPRTGLACRWRIADGIALNPGIAFGQPIVAAVGVKTDVLASAFAANGRDADRVAWWYNVAPDDVRAAVAFESRLAA